MEDVVTLARQLSAAFESRTRTATGETFRAVKDDAPEWVRDCIRAAHEDRLPDDSRYVLVEAIADHIADTEDTEGPGSGSDSSHEFSDGYVDTYNSARTAWLAAHVDNADYCDRADEEFGPFDGDMFDRIGRGQYVEASEIYAIVWSFLNDLAESMEDEGDPAEIWNLGSDA